MFGIGASEMVLIAIVALIVIGPRRLPAVARTLGTMIGRAQRYVRDVKAEVDQQMSLDELRRAAVAVKDDVEGARRAITNFGQEIDTELNTVGTSISEGMAGAASSWQDDQDKYQEQDTMRDAGKARRRFQQSRQRGRRVPQWYLKRHQQKRQLLSGAARVARFRPK